MSSGLIMDFQHNYGGYYKGEVAHCRVRIFSGVDWPVVVVSEMETNHGLSITNGAEYIAAELLRLGLVSAPFTWIEHYPRIGKADDYDLVIFKTYKPENRLRGGRWRWTLGWPDWQHISVETATRLANVTAL